MNKINKSKHKNKEEFKMYRGVGICINSAYTSYWKGIKVILMTPDVERYFSSVGHAKSYVDRHLNEIFSSKNKPWPDFEEHEKLDINYSANNEFHYDDIPF